MNLHFHSNQVKNPDQGFHSKRTSTSIYTRDPSDPDVIPLWDRYFSTGTKAETVDDLRVQNYHYVHMCSLPFVIPLFGKRAGKRSIPPIPTKCRSCFPGVGSRRSTPLIAHHPPLRSRGRARGFVIPPWDQDGITGITTFPLEPPSLSEAMSLHPDLSSLPPASAEQPRSSHPRPVQADRNVRYVPPGAA